MNHIISSLHRSIYCGISRICEGEFSRITVFSDIREVINSRSAVVRKVTDQWPVWVSARCPRCESRRGVTAGELGHHRRQEAACRAVKTTLAFVLGQAVGVG